MLRRWLSRPDPGRFAVRTKLTIHRLEDRLSPSVTKPGYPDPRLNVPFTSTELIARVTSPNPLNDITNVVNYLRLTPSIDLARTSVVFRTSGEAVVSLGLRPGASPVAVAQALSSAHGVFSWVSPNYAYTVGTASLERIPNDQLYGGQWHLPRIDAPTAWDATYGSPAVTVAVLDDGFDLSHPDLVNSFARNAGEIAGDGIDNDTNGFVDDILGWNFAGNNNNPRPTNPATDVHGTQVAGILAARADNLIGGTGVAGRVRVLAEKVTSNGVLTSLNLARAAAYAVSRGAKVITNSINIDTLVNDPVFTAAVDFAYDKGVLWINSAGNGNMADPPRVAFEQMILVSATDRTDRKESYSNYGRGIDLSAPGGNANDGLLTTVPVAAGSYAFTFGTSMTAPIVAGVAALIWSAHPGLTRDQVASRLSATADDINLLNPGYEDLLGSGRVNAGAAVTTPNVTSRLGPVSGLPEAGQPSPQSVTTFVLHLPNPLATSAVSISAFDLREAGADGVFDTEDDTAVPFSINDGKPYYYGTNDLTFTAYGLIREGSYRFTAKANALRDPFGNPVDGDRDGNAGGDLVRHFGVGPRTVGTVYEDDGGDGSEDPTDPGRGGTEVYVDDDRDGQLDESTFSSDPGDLLIADGDATGVSSTIWISGVEHPITRTTVTVTLRHPYPSDLSITLTSPSGQVLSLLRTRYVAVSPGVFSLTFDDAALSDSNPDSTGLLRPQDPLSTLVGEDANGPWTLTVTDTVVRDEGTLVGWSVSVAGEPVAVTNPDGSFAMPRDPGYIGTKIIRVVPRPGWAPVQNEQPVLDDGKVSVGIVRPGAVYGRLLLDDGDLTFGTSDRGLPGAVVYADRNGNGTFDPADPFATTDTHGNFILTGLTAGTYTFRTSVPRAFAVLQPIDGSRTVMVTAAAPSFGTDFLFITDPSADRPLVPPVTPNPRNRPVGSVTFDLSRPMSGLTKADLLLTRNGQPVPLDSATLVGSGTRYTLIGLDPITADEGGYSIRLTIPPVPQGPDGPTSPPPAVGNWTVDTTAPVATFDPATPATVRLTEPLTGLTLTNFTLTRNGVAIPLTGVTLSTTGQTAQLHNLSTLTSTPGNYVLSLAPSASVTDAAGNPLAAPASVNFTVRPRAVDRFVVAADAGTTPLLTAYDPLSGTVIWRVYAFEPTFSGGVRVATSDVNGDGVADAIVASGPGRTAEVRIFDGANGTPLTSFTAFESEFTGGAFVAAADLDADGKAELVVTPDQGGGPRVRVLADMGQSVRADFYGIADPNFRGGVRPAMGDLNRDGTPDLVVAAGFGGGPRIAGYHGAALLVGRPVKLFNDFFAFEPTLRNGTFVAFGDVTGDGYADLVTAGGPAGGPRVRILDGRNLLQTGARVTVANFFAGDPAGRGGVRVALKDLDGNGTMDLLAADGLDSTVRGYLSANLLANPTPIPDRQFDAFPTFPGGVYVG